MLTAIIFGLIAAVIVFIVLAYFIPRLLAGLIAALVFLAVWGGGGTGT